MCCNTRIWYAICIGGDGLTATEVSCIRPTVIFTDSFQINVISYQFTTCCRESESLFYDETHWPAGVELRDWVYKH